MTQKLLTPTQDEWVFELLSELKNSSLNGGDSPRLRCRLFRVLSYHIALLTRP